MRIHLCEACRKGDHEHCAGDIPAGKGEYGGSRCICPCRTDKDLLKAIKKHHEASLKFDGIMHLIQPKDSVKDSTKESELDIMFTGILEDVTKELIEAGYADSDFVTEGECEEYQDTIKRALRRAFNAGMHAEAKRVKNGTAWPDGPTCEFCGAQHIGTEESYRVPIPKGERIILRIACRDCYEKLFEEKKDA